MEAKVNELKTASTKLEQSTSDMKNNYENELKSKANDAYTVYSNLNSRSDAVLKQAEQVTNETQKLLDNANNAFESLNNINKSLTRKLWSKIKKNSFFRTNKKYFCILKNSRCPT